MYFLEKPKLCNVHIESLQDYFGSQYQGFTSLGVERVEKIVRDFGSFDSFINQMLLGGAVTTAEPRYWVEKTLVKGRPDRQSGPHGLGKALWSPQRTKDGRGYDSNMSKIRPDNVVFHFIDDRALAGVSLAASVADDTFIGIKGTPWADRPAYRIELKEFIRLDPGIERDEILKDPQLREELEEILRTHTNLFFNRKFDLNQGAYITEAPFELVKIFDQIYRRKTGRSLPHVDVEDGPTPSDVYYEFITILKRYNEEGTVFRSATKGSRYCIESVDDYGCTTRRLDANESERCTIIAYRQKKELIQSSGGAYRFNDLNGTAAKRATYLQALPFGLSPDRETILDLSNKERALEAFCGIVRNLNVDVSGGKPRLYKPAMLACAIDAIRAGELTDNRITFDLIAPKFIERMKSLGENVTEAQAATAFYHLTGDMFWMLCYHDVNESFAYGTPGPSAIRERVKHAVIKDTFWRILQDSSSSATVLNALEGQWWPPALPVTDLLKICEVFGTALKSSHISFGLQHSDLVRAFIASLATKRFVILTGLSGSGKTQLAVKFGEWLGIGRSLVVPVRPDWTGSEAIFGYEDALVPRSPDGRNAWQVPSILQFMLRAAQDPKNPYLIVLDEMNLAHVERYFADVLSGMESMQPCIPNLRKEHDGYWRLAPGAEEKILYPSNLFIAGTVNVDETTYTFSPKVLDRANTLEFRVGTKDLARNHLELEKPMPCDSGEPGLVRGFLAIASDERWHLDNPAPGVEDFTKNLRHLHELLSEGGFEFGHRVFYEAVRFAAMLNAAGDKEVEHALDLQVMQKVLPRLHGSRRRIEPILCALGRFCFDLTFDPSDFRETGIRFDPLSTQNAEPALRRSFDKIRRMTRLLRANQFVSFTE